MKTIVNKIFFGALYIFLSWKGADGLVINLFYNSEAAVDIRQLEQKSKSDSRNLKILNGIAGEDLIYYESDKNSRVDIIYPLLSYEQAEKLKKSEPVAARVLVRINNQNRNCLHNRNCLPPDSAAVKGIGEIGKENLEKSDIQAIESDLLTLDEQVILLELDEKPISWYWNLTMFLIGTYFGFALFKSFFRRASSLEDYWNKVTEKQDS